MSKREIDKLISDIPGQVKAAHASVRDVNVKNTTPEAMGSNGYDGDVVICPSDYGFDMFGATGDGYIKERSKEIAKQSLAVHGKPSSGADHSTKGDVGPKEGIRERKEVETIGLAADDESIQSVTTKQKYGSTQEGN